MMRKLGASAALLAAVAIGGEAQAYDGPWCAHYFGTDYTVNCSMVSYDMCRSETRGIGGTFCSPNPAFHPSFYAPTPTARDRRHRRLL
jgi:hypothetical protein